jgi:hypothetical protein
MSRKTITKLSAISTNPTKQQESDFINEVRKAVPEDSYLARLFSTELNNWVHNQMWDDHSCDIMAEVAFQRHQKTTYQRKEREAINDADEIRERNYQMGKEIEKRDKALGESSDRILALGMELEYATEMTEERNQEVRDVRRAYQTLSEEKANLEAQYEVAQEDRDHYKELSITRDNELAQVYEDLETAHQEILELKATTLDQLFQMFYNRQESE